jgi:hypothetical protein
MTARTPIAGAAFYTVADRRHFLGAAALLNSLRLAGHEEPLFVLDCGLTDLQLELLAPHATLVRPAADVPPPAAKATAPLRHPADAMVILDADVIVTRPLDAVIGRAKGGAIVGFANDTPGRFFPEWSELGLGEPRKQTYVNAGHLVVPAGRRDALALVAELAARVDPKRTFVAGGSPSDPLYYLDQDVLNAVLATTVEPEQIEIVEEGLAAYTPFRGLRVVDERILRCEREDGSRPLLLHHVLRKPWLAAVRPSAYSQLLTRLLTGEDVALRVPRRMIPLHLQTGRLAAFGRVRVRAQAGVHDRVRGKLGVRPKVDRLLTVRTDPPTHEAGRST